MIKNHYHHKLTLKLSYHELIIISFKYIPVPSRSNFIHILIFFIPNEPLRKIISDTRENLAHKVLHIH
ncbi:Ubiquitin carboxyl-terminal hydrolase 25 [Gossypium arboreum]|uniref:Ubiquitin carboxyl-terminal hydrolase 25 n=1 Tax=Gossypium arboreum TaxID=29729 RepID=A0A0B0PNQ6_GOSAR|nr:Ubiquitin carboxyl-terminal hydrolase 25 [Gossypium arboreum]